jgi:arylsulfatase A-like enzyme
MSEDLDTGIGMLLDEIEKLGITENTYVIYLGDNGTYPTKNNSNINGPLHGWKATLWEGGIKVPFIISGPGIEQGYNSESVSSSDLLPTICDWLEINRLPKNIDGGSLASILTKKVSKVVRENDFMVFYFPHYQHEKGTHPGVAIVKDGFKLIKYYEEDMIFLFDLKEDRLELKNLATINPKKVIELEQLINDYFSKHNIKLPTVNNDYKSENDMGLKYEQVKKRLMSEAYFIP